MRTLSDYFLKHSEQLFALAILLCVPTITYLIPYKLVFLNFFFIVILIGVYYLEAHKALMGGVLTTLLVVIYVYYFPSSFMPTFSETDLWMNILAWSSFLILTGALAGRQAHRMRTETEKLNQLKRDLQANNEKLEGWVASLVDMNS